MSNEEAKLIALQAIGECQFDVSITVCNDKKESIGFTEGIDYLDLFDKKSNDLAFKYVMSLR